MFRLGNPYPSNRTDVLLFRVVPSHSSPFVKPEATFTVVTNTSSEDLGSDLDQPIKTANLIYKVANCLKTQSKTRLHGCLPHYVWTIYAKDMKNI